MNIIIGTILFLSFTSVSTALKCYVCNAAESDISCNAGDYLDQRFLTECAQPFTKCAKTSTVKDSITLIERSCSQAELECSATEFGFTWSCDKDGCNNGNVSDCKVILGASEHGNNGSGPIAISMFMIAIAVIGYTIAT